MSGLNSHRHRKDRVSGQLAPLPRTSSYGSHHSHASGSGHDRPRDGETAPAGPPPTDERINDGGGGGGGGGGGDAHWNIGRSKHTVAFPSDAHRSVPAPSSPSHTTGGRQSSHITSHAPAVSPGCPVLTACVVVWCAHRPAAKLPALADGACSVGARLLCSCSPLDTPVRVCVCVCVWVCGTDRHAAERKLLDDVRVGG